MKLTFEFLQNDEGSTTIQWLETAAGILTIGVMTVYAILNGEPIHVTPDMGSAVASTNTQVNVVAAPDPIESKAFLLTEAVALPVGSVAVHSDHSFTVFRTPDSGWVDAFSNNGMTVPEGATLTSTGTFTLNDGGTVAASSFSRSYEDAYSSSVAYDFTRRPLE